MGGIGKKNSFYKGLFCGILPLFNEGWSLDLVGHVLFFKNVRMRLHKTSLPKNEFFQPTPTLCPLWPVPYHIAQRLARLVTAWCSDTVLHRLPSPCLCVDLVLLTVCVEESVETGIKTSCCLYFWIYYFARSFQCGGFAVLGCDDCEPVIETDWAQGNCGQKVKIMQWDQSWFVICIMYVHSQKTLTARA